MAYQQVTLAQLRLLLQQRWESVPFWTTADADAAINEALQVWNVATGYWREDSTATMNQGDPFVVFPAPIVMGTRMTHGSLGLALTSVHDLDNARPGWQGTTDTAPWAWALVSLDLAIVYPSTSLLSSTVVVEGLMKTPALVNPADFLNLGQEELGAILSYALHAAAYKVGGDVLQQTEPLRIAFWQAASLRNQQLLRSLPLRGHQGRQDAGMDPIREQAGA